MDRREADRPPRDHAVCDRRDPEAADDNAAAHPALTAALGAVAHWIATALDAGCMICLHSDDSPALHPTVTYHPDPATQARLHAALVLPEQEPLEPDGQALPTSEVRRRTVALSPTAATADSAIDFQILLAPLPSRQGTIGTLVVLQPAARGPFSATQETLLHTLVEGAGLIFADAQRQATTQLPMTDQTAHLEGVVAELREQLTVRARSESVQAHLLAQVQAAEARFRGLVEAAPDGVIIVDEVGRIESTNRQVEVLFGYHRDELCHQPIEVLIPARFHSRHVGLRTGYIADPHTRPMGIGMELYGLRKDGSEVPVEISLSPLRAGEALLIIATIRDVTEQRRASRQLRETAAQLAQQTDELARSNEELEQFAYVASHDLQEPLRMVASYTQLLARRYQGRLDADADEFIGYAVDGANRMRQLIQDLLAYSRVGTRGQDFRPVDCAILIDGIFADLGPVIAETGALVTHDALPTVVGDPTQLRQLFQNLIGNALKYRRTDVTPEVRIGAKHEGESWHFSVRDNGIGIAPEYRERIFVIFQRLHTQEEYPGTGIGLAICKKIAERHGGRIWVESTLGVGTTLHLLLPVPAQRDEVSDDHDG